MSSNYELTLADIKSLADNKVFSRGQGYYKDGSIANTVKRDDELEATCKGSYAKPYRVWARLGKSGVVEMRCNCEYDWGGACKHIVAMLLTYLHKPQLFAEKPALTDDLMGRSKEELVELIERMLTRYPDLQSLVDKPVTTVSAKGKDGGVVDTVSIRQQLREAFEGGYDYDYYGDEDDEIEGAAIITDTVRAAERFAKRGDWKNASALYRAILDEFAQLSDYPEYDYDYELAGEIDLVITKLAECLGQSEIVNDDTERRAALDSLLAIYVWDTNTGVTDMGADVPDAILQSARREDLPTIRQVLEFNRDQYSSRQYRSHAVEAYSAFLAELDVIDEVDPEVTLARLREQEMYALLFNKLLDLNRIDEAVAVARQHLTNPFERTRALYTLVQHHHEQRAIQFAEELLKLGYDDQLADWLIQRYEAQDDTNNLFRWRLAQMQHEPREERYILLKAVSQKLGNWDEVRKTIIKDLEKREQYALLVQAYLHDEEWDAAWKLLPKALNRKANPYGWWGEDLEFRVAEKSCHALPEKALPVYIRSIRGHIDARNRDAYAQAAELLVEVQEMYDQTDDEESWLKLIEGIRQEFKKLRALQDELNKAGL